MRFELTVPLPARQFSKLVLSTAQPPHLYTVFTIKFAGNQLTIKVFAVKIKIYKEVSDNGYSKSLLNFDGESRLVGSSPTPSAKFQIATFGRLLIEYCVFQLRIQFDKINL